MGQIAHAVAALGSRVGRSKVFFRVNPRDRRIFGIYDFFPSASVAGPTVERKSALQWLKSTTGGYSCAQHHP
jgi:hypothetical protein